MRWISYVSDESGRPEVYIQTYPIQTRLRPVNNPFQVSMDASRDGRRFLIKTPAASTDLPVMTVVMNWPALTRGSR